VAEKWAASAITASAAIFLMLLLITNSFICSTQQGAPGLKPDYALQAKHRFIHDEREGRKA
jgi:hypothetical protein